jgi:hypothetical protein
VQPIATIAPAGVAAPAGEPKETMSTNSTDSGQINNNGHVPAQARWGATSTDRFPALPKELLNYALRAVVRHDTLRDALQVGSVGEDTPVPAAMIASEQGLHGLLWDACAFCHRQHGHLDDRELLYLTAVELQTGSLDYPQVTGNEVGALVNSFYCGAPPDATAGRQAIADVLVHYLADRVDAQAWADWAEEHGEPPRQVLVGVQQIRQEIEDFRAGAERSGPFSTVEFRQRTQTREEIIGDVLVAHQLAVIGAATKSLKTLTSLDAAISIATGTPWLSYEYWSCSRPRRVGFFSAESGAETLLHKHDVIAASKRNRLACDQRMTFEALLGANIFWDDQVPDLSDPASVQRLRQIILREHLEVVFVDPLSMAIGSAAKDLANMAVAGQVILRAARVCRQAGCTLVLVHHTAGDRTRLSSERARSPLDLTDIAYPAITNHARQWITLNRAEPYDELTRQSVLWLRAAGSGLQAGGTFRVAITEGRRHDLWQVDVETETQYFERQQGQREHDQRLLGREHENSILQYLEHHPGATINAMSRDAELPRIGATQLGRLLPELQRRQVVRCEDVRRNGGTNNIRRWYRVGLSAGGSTSSGAAVTGGGDVGRAGED